MDQVLRSTSVTVSGSVLYESKTPANLSILASPSSQCEVLSVKGFHYFSYTYSDFFTLKKASRRGLDFDSRYSDARTCDPCVNNCAGA